MTREIAQFIYDTLYKWSRFLAFFWDSWGWLFTPLPVVKDIVKELEYVVTYLEIGIEELLSWWDYRRDESTFLNDIYHFILYLRVGFDLYRIFEGDPENVARVVYYPAIWTYHLLVALEFVLFTLNEWYLVVTEKINYILNWEVIKSNILSWLPNIENIEEWFDSWWDSVRTKVTEWWELEANPIRLFIIKATEGLPELLKAWNDFWTITWPEFTGRLDALDAAWDDFWTITWPQVLTIDGLAEWWTSTMVDVQDLINSAFTLRDDLWAGWQDFRESVAEFFSDPLEFLWTRFTDWFLGPEV